MSLRRAAWLLLALALAGCDDEVVELVADAPPPLAGGPTDAGLAPDASAAAITKPRSPFEQVAYPVPMGQDIIADMVRHMVDGFSADVEAVQVGVVDARTPEAARRVLAAGLAYLAEPGDLISDDLAGIGIMDDAALLRLAARGAVAAGATDDALLRLAREADDLAYIFGDLVVKLEEMLAFLQRPNARGLTPIDVIADPARRMELWRQINECRAVAGAHSQAAQNVDAAEFVRTMRNAIRRRLKGFDEIG